MSTWASLDALADFVFRTRHADVMRGRRVWFEAMKEAYAALWWVAAGHRPTVKEAEERVAHLRALGPTAFAFTFKAPFPAPSSETTPRPRDEECPV